MLHSPIVECYVGQLANATWACPETAGICLRITDLQIPQTYYVCKLDISLAEVNCLYSELGAYIRILAPEGE